MIIRPVARLVQLHAAVVGRSVAARGQRIYVPQALAQIRCYSQRRPSKDEEFGESIRDRFGIDMPEDIPLPQYALGDASKDRVWVNAMRINPDRGEEWDSTKHMGERQQYQPTDVDQRTWQNPEKMGESVQGPTGELGKEAANRPQSKSCEEINEFTRSTSDDLGKFGNRQETMSAETGKRLREQGEKAWDTAKQAEDIAKDVGRNLWNETEAAGERAWETAKDMGARAVSATKESTERVWESAKHMGDRSKPSSDDFGGRAWENAKDLGHQAKDTAQDASTRAWENAKDLGHQAKDTAQDASTRAWENAKDLGHQAKDTAQDASTRAWENAKDLGHQAKDTAQDASTRAWDRAKDMGEKAKDTTADMGARVWESAKDTTADISHRAWETAKDLGEKAKHVAEDVGHRAWEGTKESVTSATQQVKEAVRGPTEELRYTWKDTESEGHHRPGDGGPWQDVKHAGDHAAEALKKTAHGEWTHRAPEREHTPGEGTAAEEMREAGDHLKSSAESVVQKVKRWISNKH